MYKIFAVCAAVAVTALVALPNPVSASERRSDGMRNSDQIEVSSARRRRYYPRRYYGPRYYRQPYYRQPYYAPYYAPVPYWRPAPFPFIFGFPG